MNHFLAMGGYGQHVRPCYAATLLLVILNIYWARRSLTYAKTEARRRLPRVPTD